MKTITISSKNQVVIPSAVRARLGVGAGDKLIVGRVTDKEVVLKKNQATPNLLVRYQLSNKIRSSEFMNLEIIGHKVP
jgi:AbrB family looped-hinge helix DNA binding protein